MRLCAKARKALAIVQRGVGWWMLGGLRPWHLLAPIWAWGKSAAGGRRFKRCRDRSRHG